MPTKPAPPHAGTWYVVGVRTDGSRCVLADRTNQDDAEAAARVFASHLEGYVSVQVARHSRPPVVTIPAGEMSHA
jgi:hypothetical protein